MFTEPDEVDYISPLNIRPLRSQDVAMSYDSGCMGDGVQVSGYPPATELDLFVGAKIEVFIALMLGKGDNNVKTCCTT